LISTNILNLLKSSESLFFLAPLAGYTDLPFRSVVKKFGCDVTFSEMININAIAYNNEKTKKMMIKSSIENPYFIQIAANNIQNAIKAVENINENNDIQGIDINLGCPVKKARKSGYGGVLLKDENQDKLKEIITAIIKTSKKPVSAKIRLGFDKIVASERAKLLEDLGIKFLTVHGRSVKQMYKGNANYEEIKKVVKAVNIPVIANGDITDYEKAKFVLEFTGAKGVAIGRGTIGRPWIFLEMKQQGEITSKQKKEVLFEHFNQMINWYGEYGAILFRKHLYQYSKGINKASEFRTKINQETNPSKITELIEEYF